MTTTQAPEHRQEIFISLLVYLSTCLLVNLFTRLLVYLSTCLLVYLFTCLLVNLFTCLLVYLFTCLLVYSSTHPLNIIICHIYKPSSDGVFSSLMYIIYIYFSKDILSMSHYCMNTHMPMGSYLFGGLSYCHFF
jgi:hypothetical protein